jgi:hypothetical protein
VRTSFDRLVDLYQRCGPIVVIAQKTRIVFMVRVRFGGCIVRRDRLQTSISLPRRVEHPRWTRIEELAPGWIAHHLEIRDPAALDDAELAALICESYRQIGEQRRLKDGEGPRVAGKAAAGYPVDPGSTAARSVR